MTVCSLFASLRINYGQVFVFHFPGVIQSVIGRMPDQIPERPFCPQHGRLEWHCNRRSGAHSQSRRSEVYRHPRTIRAPSPSPSRLPIYAEQCDPGRAHRHAAPSATQLRRENGRCRKIPIPPTSRRPCRSRGRGWGSANAKNFLDSTSMA